MQTHANEYMQREVANAIVHACQQSFAQPLDCSVLKQMRLVCGSKHQGLRCEALSNVPLEWNGEV